MQQLTQDSEFWLPVLGFSGRYEVSSVGQVRNTETGRLLTPQISNSGYVYVALWHGNKKACRFVHRLLMQASTGQYGDGLQVNHKDGDRKNNRLQNLEWATASENVLHSRNVLNKIPPITEKGEANPNNRPVEAVDECGAVVYRFDSIELTSEAGFQPPSVAHSIKGVRQKRHRGLYWRYADMARAASSNGSFKATYARGRGAP